jgi:hypothetical protein
MTPDEIVAATLVAIEKSGLDYVIVGAFAAGYHSFVRATKDADFVVAAPLSGIEKILPHFPAVFHLDPQPQVEMLTGTSRWIVLVEGTEFRVEIFHLSNDPHHAAIFQRKKAVNLPMHSGKTWILTAEDLVIQKVRWGRTHDLDDARNIVAVQGDALDFRYIESWCQRHGTIERLAAIRASVLPND